MLSAQPQLKWCALAGEGYLHLYKWKLVKNAVFFILLPPFTMANISEKQQPPTGNPAVYPTNQANQGYYPAGNQPPTVVNVVPQPLAVTGQQYRDQCKSLLSY